MSDISGNDCNCAEAEMMREEIVRLRGLIEEDREYLSAERQKHAAEVAGLREALARAKGDRDGRQREVVRLRAMLEQEVETLSKFVAEQEREACVKAACDEFSRFKALGRRSEFDEADIAAAIRARGAK